MRTKTFRAGFTIVELLIVVVVIAILAAITIVSYNGITGRAKASAAQTAAETASKKVQTYMITNSDQAPANLAIAGITDSGGITYQYSSNTSTTPQTFCITATTSNVSYFIDNTSHTSPTAGGCPGHSANGVATITNLITNPNAESSLFPWAIAGGGAGGTIAVSTDWAHSGTSSFKVTTNYGNVAGGDARYYTSAGYMPSGFIAGHTYTASAWVYTPAANTTFSTATTSRQRRILFWYSTDGTNYIENFGPQGANISGTQRLSYTFTIPTNATGMALGVGAAGSSTDTSFTSYVDDVMVTEGSTLYNYADGNSLNWAWTGSTNGSTSTGMPL